MQLITTLAEDVNYTPLEIRVLVSEIRREVEEGSQEAARKKSLKTRRQQGYLTSPSTVDESDTGKETGIMWDSLVRAIGTEVVNQVS